MRKNFGSSVGLAVVFVIVLGLGVYSGLDKDSLQEDEVYKLSDVAMKVEVGEGYGSKILTSNPVLIVHGDEKKVRKMKKNGEIPEVIIDLKRKKSGEYEGKPKVVGTLFGVHYTFEPEMIDVAVLDAEVKKFAVIEREYGLAGDGRQVGQMLVSGEAELLVTEEQELTIGKVIADVNVEGLTESRDVLSRVIVLDKRGNIMTNVPVVTEEVYISVTIEKMGWLQTKEDIIALTEEITVLEGELAQRLGEEKEVQDVLRKKDLQKEINFREARLEQKHAELVNKEQGLDEQVEVQERQKIATKREALVED